MSQTYIPAELRRLVREHAHDRCEYSLHPRKDWSSHFQLVGARIEPLTEVGRVTVQLLIPIEFTNEKHCLPPA